jgi:hypothetical protein
VLARAPLTWVGDRASYSLVAVMSDGSEGPAIPLRGLFEEYHGESMFAVETIVARALQTPKWECLLPLFR